MLSNVEPLEADLDSFLRRAFARIQITDSCWLFTGCKDQRGYGMIYFGDRQMRAHRAVWQAINGPVRPGLCLDHLCRVRNCINPAHLEPVTNRENILRGEGLAAKQARQTHCKRGHELSGANLYLWRGKFRQCRTCNQARVSAWKKSHRKTS